MQAAVRPRVHIRLDGDPHVGTLHLLTTDGADPGQLLIASFPKEKLGRAVDVETKVRVPAGVEDASPDLPYERRGCGGGVDADQVACTNPGRVVDENAREALH
jgi:hypothetical protein